MNKRLALHAAFFSFLAPSLTGCMCSSWVGGHIGIAYYDKFNPSAVYKREKPASFALGGTRQTRDRSFPAFLIVDDYLLARANAQTNQTLSLEDIQKAYELIVPGDKALRKIPPDYIKVAVLPKNDFTLELGMHHPGAGWACLMPFAFIADLATFPLQVIYVAAGGDPGWTM